MGRQNLKLFLTSGNVGNNPPKGPLRPNRLPQYRLRDEEMKAAVNIALKSGYRHLDTAYLYQNEQAIGEALEEWLTSGKLKREDLFITTKLPAIGNREKDVPKFLQKSLDMLRLKYVDLYLVHNPVGMIGRDDNDIIPVDEQGNIVLDLETDLEGLWKAMEAQVDAGKAKSIGLSNFNSEQIERILKVARIKPANLQIEVHAYQRPEKLLEVCKQHGIPVCGYSPLGAPYMDEGGKNTPRGEHPLAIQIGQSLACCREKKTPLMEHPLVTKISQSHEKTPAQVLLRHLIQHGVTVIPKSSKPERIQQNLQIFDFELSSEEMASLDSLDQGGAGRLYHFKFLRGITKHPEWPFRIPF